MSLNASVGPFDTCSRCRPGSSVDSGVISSLPKIVARVRARRRSRAGRRGGMSSMKRDRIANARSRIAAAAAARPARRRRSADSAPAPRARRRAPGLRAGSRENGCGCVGPRAAGADVAHQLQLFEPDAHDLAADRRQRLDLRDRGVDVLLDRAVREQDDVGLVLALRRLLLDHRVDRDLAVGEDARDVGEHAGLVLDAHAQVIARLDLAHRQERHVGELVGLEREVRHAMLGVGGVHARDVDEVGDHRARRRLGARAGAVVQRRRRPRRP